MDVGDLAALDGEDTLGCCFGCGHCCDVRDLLTDSRLTDEASVRCAALSRRCVDDELNLLVDDDILNVRAACAELVDLGHFEAGCLDELEGSACSDELKACLGKIANNLKNFCLITIVNAYECCAFKRKKCLCCFLCLEECLAEVLRDTKNLTCRLVIKSRRKMGTILKDGRRMIF